MPNQTLYHAYFSQKQKELIMRKPRSITTDKQPHTNIYLTIDGNEVEITEVNKINLTTIKPTFQIHNI